ARGDNEVELTDEESFDFDDEDEVAKIFRTDTNVFDFETPMCRAFKELNYLLQIDQNVLTKDMNGLKLMTNTRMIGLMIGTKMCHRYTKNHGLTLEELKEKALKNKTIMEGMIEDDNESSNEGWRRWDGYEITNCDIEYENEHDDEEKCESFDDHNLSVYTIRRFEMIKYSFGQDEEYVVVKEDEYEDLTSTSEDACRGYQEIFRKMDE
nr:hypothetical protein [Tanacetum cinerariifolium]